jgi:hypothetical protein
MSTKEEMLAVVIECLNQLDDEDQEKAHGEADGHLITALHILGGTEVALAYEKARNRVGFWYS